MVYPDLLHKSLSIYFFSKVQVFIQLIHFNGNEAKVRQCGDFSHHYGFSPNQAGKHTQNNVFKKLKFLANLLFDRI